MIAPARVWHLTPPDDLGTFAHFCRCDFLWIAERKPDAAEVAAWREANAEEAARRLAHLDGLSAA